MGRERAYMAAGEFVSRSIQAAHVVMPLSKTSILVAGMEISALREPLVFQHQFFHFTIEVLNFHEMLNIYVKMKDDENHVYDACMVVSTHDGSIMAHWVGVEPPSDDQNMTLFKMMTYDCLKLHATI